MWCARCRGEWGKGCEAFGTWYKQVQCTLAIICLIIFYYWLCHFYIQCSLFMERYFLGVNLLVNQKSPLGKGGSTIQCVSCNSLINSTCIFVVRLVCVGLCVKVITSLNDGIYSEKYIIRQFCCCASIIVYSHTPSGAGQSLYVASWHNRETVNRVV